MNKPSSASIGGIGLTLLFLSLMGTYLLVELGYNAWLLDVSGSGEIDPNELKELERFGRAMAASGFTLFCLSVGFGAAGYRLTHWPSLLLGVGMILLSALPFFWAKDWFVGGADNDGSGVWVILPLLSLVFISVAWVFRADRPWGTIFLIITLPMATFTGMYHGQLIAIERWVVDSSTGEERRQAQLLSLLKRGYTEGIVTLGDVQRDGELLPEEKTLLAFSGVLFSNNQTLLDDAEQKKSLIIGELMELHDSDGLDNEYARYQRETKRFIEQAWKPYTKMVKEYDSALATVSERAAMKWNALIDDLDQRWYHYAKQRDKYTQALDEKVPTIHRRITSLDKGLENCSRRHSDLTRRRDCRLRHIRSYNRDAQRFLGQEVPWQKWCVEQSFSEAVKGGRPPGLLDIVRNRGKTLRCPGPTQHLSQVLSQLKWDDFIQKSGGYPPDLQSKGQFQALPKTQQLIRKELTKQDILLPDTWSLADRDIFISRVESRLYNKIQQHWEEQSRAQLGTVTAPIRDFSRFEQHPAIQDKIRQDFSLSESETLSLTLSRNEYRQLFVVPMIEQELEQQAAALRTAEYFADGGSREEDGRNAIRGMRIPAISLTLSLTFALFGITNLIATLARTGSVLLFSGFHGLFHRTIFLAVWAGVMSAIVILPYHMETRLTQSTLYEYFLEEQLRKNPALGYGIDWLLRTQPLIYPFGEQIHHWMQRRYQFWG